MKNKEYSKWLKLLIIVLGVTGSVLSWFGLYYHDVWGKEQFPALGADGGARKIFDNPGDVNVTPDSALADYSRGDVLIWDKSETNKYGHVAILVAVYNTKYFIVLEQDGFKQNGVQLAFRSRENLRGALWV